MSTLKLATQHAYDDPAAHKCGICGVSTPFAIRFKATTFSAGSLDWYCRLHLPTTLTWAVRDIIDEAARVFELEVKKTRKGGQQALPAPRSDNPF